MRALGALAGPDIASSWGQVPGTPVGKEPRERVLGEAKPSVGSEPDPWEGGRARASSERQAQGGQGPTLQRAGSDRRCHVGWAVGEWGYKFRAIV